MTTPAMTRTVKSLNAVERGDELLLELSDALWCRHPAANGGRLDNDALDLISALERPLGAFGTHGRSGVEHQLRVFGSINSNTITKLPIKDNGPTANTANKVSASKHAWQKVAKADASVE